MLKSHAIIPVCLCWFLLGCERNLQLNSSSIKAKAAQDSTIDVTTSNLQQDSKTVRSVRKSVDSEQDERVKQLLEQVKADLAKNNWQQAEQRLQQVLELDPTNLAAGRAQRQLQQEKRKQLAEKENSQRVMKQKQAEELARNKEEFARLMKEGKEALAAEDHEQAAASFEAARKLNPDDADAALFLGMAKRDQEREKAEEAQRQKEIEEQKQQEARLAQDEKNKRMKADEALRAKLKIDKERAEALKKVNLQQLNQYLTMARMAMQDKRYADALSAADKALKLFPEDDSAKELQTQARKELDAQKKKHNR